MKDKKLPDCLWAALIGSLVFIFFPCSSWIPESFKVKMAWSEVSMVWPQKSRAYSVYFPPGFSLGFQCQQNGRTELQPLWSYLLLLFKWPALLSCINNYFCFYTHRFQPYMGPGINICSIILFRYPTERRRFFQSFLGSSSVGSYFS